MKKGKYRTKQGEQILAFMQDRAGEHITVHEIYQYFEHTEHKLGVTTIYRQIDKLVQEGLVKKYVLDPTSPACFEYLEHNKSCAKKHCTHLKCIKCGKLFHMQCKDWKALESHILQAHHFKLDMTRSVLYGLCESCQETACGKEVDANAETV